MRRAVLLLLVAWTAAGATSLPFARTEPREPCAAFDPLRRPFFGDLHVHTALSLDASTQDTRNRPRDAYRFAQGQPMGIQPYDDAGVAQRTVRLDRPLDFVAVTDHAELFGEVRICQTPGLPGYDVVDVPTLPLAAARGLLHDERRLDRRRRADPLRLLRRWRPPLPGGGARSVARGAGRGRSCVRPDERVPLHDASSRTSGASRRAR